MSKSNETATLKKPFHENNTTIIVDILSIKNGESNPMKNKLSIAIIFLLVLSIVGFAGCRGETSESNQRQIATVERSDLIVTVPADGNLELPEARELFFDTTAFTPPYSGVITWEPPDLKEGDFVREGTLLAKLDDTYQKKNVAIAQYDVELAMNELVEKIPPSLMGYPEMYPDTSTVLRVEQAQEEVSQAQKFLEQSKYQEAAAELRLAQHDLDASYKMLNIPEIAMALQRQSEIRYPGIDKYPNMASISRAIKLVEEDLARLAEIQTLIQQGSYDDAKAQLNAEQIKLSQTHVLVESLSGRIRISQRIGECCQQYTEATTGLMPLPYPDTSTSLAWLKQAEENLQKIQACKDSDSCDELELSTLLRMAQHDVDMSQTILENNELIFRSGLNLKVLRQSNLNLKKTQQALEKAKESLMKTEILAPFDGIIEDINLKQGDSIGQRFSVTGEPVESYVIRLVNTKDWKMDGVVDEVDIYKVKVGQEAIITVDALPNAEMRGKVTFISPFGTQTAGVVEFPVIISLEPSSVVATLEAVGAKEDEKKGGLTATADIIVEKHENVLLVPNRSVKGSPGNYYVEVVTDEEKVTTEKRPVTLGAQSEQFSEVISGLSEGEKIIVEPTRGRLPTPF
jgi:HlyD family secretion protein